MSNEINLLYLLCTTCLDEEIPELYLADKPSFEIISTIIMEQWTNMYPCREWSYGIFIDIIKIDTNKLLNTYFSTGKPDEPSVQRWLLERYDNAIKPFIDKHETLGDLYNWKLKLRISEMY